MVALMLLPGHCVYAQGNGTTTSSQPVVGSRDVPVTAVADESWIIDLHRTMAESRTAVLTLAP